MRNCKERQIARCNNNMIIIIKFTFVMYIGNENAYLKRISHRRKYKFVRICKIFGGRGRGEIDLSYYILVVPITRV